MSIPEQEKEKDVLQDLQRELEQSVKDDTQSKVDLFDDETATTFGERLADKVAAFGGSWRFILIFCGILLLWVLLNTILILTEVFDPYPFIFLNLVLSCISAFQAPVILMSQNRREANDRKRAKNDYIINLKAEIEIRELHDKIDKLVKLVEGQKKVPDNRD